MNPEYDYKSWKNRLSTFHNWWGRKFELLLEQIFKIEGELLQRQPELENGTKPDFLVEDDEGKATRLSLIDQLDYMGKLSSQLEWQSNPADSRMRVVYTKSGEPTAAVIRDDKALIDHILYWIPCRDGDEANYLLAIINSNALQEAVQPFMSKGQFGARDLHKHLWKLPIPEYDPGSQLHVEITQAGASAATGAGAQLAALRKARGDRLTSTIARRELRKWLRESDEGKTVEKTVTKLLAGD